MRDKNYYIVDTYGTYYGFNESNKFIAVAVKSEAA